MPITFTNEQRALADAVRDFCAKECGTREQRDALTDGGDERHHQGIYDQMAELGWLGIACPEEFGGAGGGMVDLCMFLEETSRGMAPIGGFSVSMIVAGAYERFGTEAQKQAMIGGIVAGNVASIAMSEPDAGSDVGNMKCRAVRENGSYVINGQKTWISEAHVAKHILLICRTNSTESKHEGMTMLEVPTDANGIEIRPIPTMGGKIVNDVFFTDCVVPADAVVGTDGKAWPQLMTGLNVERLILAGSIIGEARRAFDDLLSYVTERIQFGRPIGSFQSLKHRIADLATELECARLLCYDVAQAVDAHPDRLFAREASMAKLKCTEVAKKLTLEGLQMMGGYGYATEYDMESHVRRALASTIYGGTSEIQREVIARTYGL